MLRWIVLIVIAAICGSVGSKLAGARAGGCVASIALGFVGALIGGWISRETGVPDLIYVVGVPVIWSIVGSSVFVALIHLISGGSRQ